MNPTCRSEAYARYPPRHVVETRIKAGNDEGKCCHFLWQLEKS